MYVCMYVLLIVQHKQFEKAIELYMMAKRWVLLVGVLAVDSHTANTVHGSRFHSAVEMCLQHKVNITDEMVEKLTPPEV